MKVILLMAVTADGMIARDSRQLVDWTGKADKKYFVEITRKAGVMIMGSKTFDTIGGVLPERLNVVMTRDKTRKSDHENLVFTDDPPEVLLEKLESQGFESAALIGGAIVNTLFVRKNLIDEIHLTIVPILFGKGLSLFTQELDIKLLPAGEKELDHHHKVMIYKVLK